VRRPEPDVSLGQDVADVLRTAVGQGAAMGFGDEIEAAVRAPFSDRTYAEIRDDVRAQNADFGRRHPVLAPSLEVAGAIGSAFVPGLNVAGAAKGATALGRIGRAAATGAALGAVTGIGKDESGTAGGMAASAAGGAAGGFLGGAALQGAGEAVRAGWQATQAGARLLDVAEKVAPARSLKDALAQRRRRRSATRRRTATCSRASWPTGARRARWRQVARDLPESIPVSVVDLAARTRASGSGRSSGCRGRARSGWRPPCQDARGEPADDHAPERRAEPQSRRAGPAPRRRIARQPDRRAQDGPRGRSRRRARGCTSR
jgi:hypothetical protein